MFWRAHVFHMLCFMLAHSEFAFMFVCFVCAGRACWFGKVLCCRIHRHCFHCCFRWPWIFVRVMWKLIIIHSLDLFADLNDDIATCMLSKYMLVWESNRFGNPSSLFLLVSSLFPLPLPSFIPLPSAVFLPSSSSFPLPSFLFLFLLRESSVWDSFGVTFRQWVFDLVGRNIGGGKNESLVTKR